MADEDAISRSDAIRIASGYCHWTNIPAELAKLPSVNPKPCEDAISRQAALDIYSKWHPNRLKDHNGFEKDLMELPSVSTEKTDAYKQGWHDAIETALKEVYTIQQYDDIFRVVQEETLIGVGMAYEQVSTEKTGRWIPVSERLPEAGEYIGNVAKYYLVQNEYGDMLVARYTHSEYWEQMYQLKPISDEIVAWMPLPEPYTGAKMEVEE